MRTDAGKQSQMQRTCDNEQTNIVTEALRTVHYRVPFAYSILFTNGRAGLLKLDWVRLSVIAILLSSYMYCLWYCKMRW